MRLPNQATTTAQSNVRGAGCTSLGFALLGFGTQTVAINTLHPAGMAGCNLLVTPDVSFLLVPAAGTASFSVGVPAVAAFAGLNINLQAAQLELNAQLQLISLSSTNGVALTIGAL